MQTINKAGLDLIKSFEGLRLTSYKDSVGVWTIGYGHIRNVKKGQVISAEQAEEFLRQDLQQAERDVNNLNIQLTDNQFAALVSFTFNLGKGNLLKLVSKKPIANRIILFNHAGGKTLDGLTRRRIAERALFLKKEQINNDQ